MTTSYTLKVQLAAADKVDEETRQNLNAVFNTNDSSSACTASSISSSDDVAARLPIVCAESFRLFPSVDDATNINDAAAAGDAAASSPRLAAVFCPGTLVESSYEQLDMQQLLRNSNGTSSKTCAPPPVLWSDDCARLSNVLLSLIHPFLAHNFTIKAILSSSVKQQAPADLVLLDLSHTPHAAIIDLMEFTNCQLVHSGPEAILKVLLLNNVVFVTTTESSSQKKISPLPPQQPPSLTNDLVVSPPAASAGASGDIPTCPVCLHRIDPPRLGLPRPRNHHLCSKFCPPPNLTTTISNSSVGEAAVSCPRQRVLQPWPAPNYCVSCHVIRDYWRRDEDDQASGGGAGGGATTTTSDSSVVVGDQLVCTFCGMKETLWVCLTCAFVGCGRYSNKHAAQHYMDSGHPFCLELSTLRIWSYSDGEFAHRLDLLECPSSPPLLHPWVVRGSVRSVSSVASVAAAAAASSDYLDTSSTGGGSAGGNQFENDYERMLAANFASVDEKSPKKATMVGEEYEALLQSALEEQAQHYEGEISWLRATLTAEQVDHESMTSQEEAEIENIRKQIADLRSDIDRAGRNLLDSQAQEAGHRATSQRLLREQQVTQGLLKKIREESACEHEQGKMQIEELEQQIADLTANQKMRHQFSQDEELMHSQIFGTTETESSPQPKSGKKGKKSKRFFRR